MIGRVTRNNLFWSLGAQMIQIITFCIFFICDNNFLLDSRRYGTKRVDNTLAFLLLWESLITTLLASEVITLRRTSERLKLVAALNDPTMT